MLSMAFIYAKPNLNNRQGGKKERCGFYRYGSTTAAGLSLTDVI